jgi:hypothetical protein
MLRYVIQAVMGWESSHLHQFIAEKVFYTDTSRHEYGLDAGDEDNYERGEKIHCVVTPE